MKLTRTLQVKNRLGLHARPASAIAQALAHFKSKVSLFKEQTEVVDGKSIMGILLLAARCGTKLEVSVEGPDAALAMEKAVELIEKSYE